MKYKIFTFCFLFSFLLSNAQIGIGTTTPHSSSILDLTASDKGFLAPRMTQAQRIAISSPAVGLLVYQTDATAGFYYFNGVSWIMISTSSGDNLGNHTATQNVILNGNWLSGDGNNEGVFVKNDGKVGIGTNNPNEDMHLHTNNSTTTFLITHSNGNTQAFFIDHNTINGTRLMNKSNTGMALGTDNSTRMFIDNIGRVGIGTLNPSKELHVVGDVRVTGLGNGLVRSDVSGNLTHLAYTTSSDVLRGDGTFGAVPIGNTAWSTTGNTGLTAGTHFIGNTDNVPFEIKVDNARAGYLSTVGKATVFYGQGAGASWTQASGGNFNTGIGYNSLNTLNSGINNTAVGANALKNNTADNNTALGYNTLTANTSGTNNTAVGTNALATNSTSDNNTAIGYWSLKDNTGAGNTSVGSQSLQSNTTGINNSAYGYQSLQNNTTGSRNIGLGFQVLFNNIDGARNTGLGYQTLASGVSSSEGTAVGYLSQQNINNSNTPYTNTNVSLGAFSLQGTSTPANNVGLNNVALGHSALTRFRNADDNVVIGYEAMNDPTAVDADRNIAIGTEALKNNSFQHDNIAIGFNALKNHDFGTPGSSYNIAIGNNALFSNVPNSTSNGIHNVAIGHNSLLNNTVGLANIAIGNNSMDNNTTGRFNVAIGYNSLLTNIAGDQTVAIGYEAMRYANNSTLSFNTNNTALGYQALRGSINPSANTGVSNTAIGHSVLLNNTSGSGNTATGVNALFSNTTGTNNTSMGLHALMNNTSGNNNTAFGAYSLTANSNGHGNTALGVNSLQNNSSGWNNTACGFFALQLNTIGSNNIAIGYNNLSNNNVGNNNTSVGSEALYFNTAASRNVAIGSNALRNQSFSNGGVSYISDNVAIGYGALFNTNPTSTSTGINNTAVGTSALFSNTNGSNNTAIGYNANVASGNLTNATAIGANAVVGTSNAIVLGGTGANSVNVGIGLTVPVFKLDVRLNNAKTVNSHYNVFQVATNEATDFLGLQIGLNCSGTATLRYGSINVVEFPSTPRNLVLQDNSANIGIGTANPNVKLDVRNVLTPKATTATFTNVFQIATSDGADPLTLRLGLKRDATASNRYLGINAYDGAAAANLFIQGNSLGNIGFGTTSLVGTDRFQFGDGTYNPNITLRSNTGNSFGISFYENTTLRSSLGHSTIAGQNWFYIYGAGGNNILRSKNGYTAIGEEATAGFHSTLETTGSFAAPITNMSADLTLNHTHFVINRTAGDITLPAASTCPGRIYIIVNRGVGLMNISSYVNFTGGTQTTILGNSAITIMSDGTNWLRIQ